MARIAGVLPGGVAGHGTAERPQGLAAGPGAPGQGRVARIGPAVHRRGPRQSTDPSVETPVDGLTALLLRMDAEPVRFVKGGFIH